jgi:hypothetical protein
MLDRKKLEGTREINRQYVLITIKSYTAIVLCRLSSQRTIRR